MMLAGIDPVTKGFAFAWEEGQDAA
jgi:hypothetical protein